MGGGDFLIQPLIIPLKLLGLFESCRSTSTCVGALKFPLRRLTSGREFECEFARCRRELDVVVENGAFEMSLIDCPWSAL